MRTVVQVDLDELRVLRGKNIQRALVRALKKAGSTALRDMRSEATKRIRARKAIKAKVVRDAISLVRASGSTLERLEWTVRVSGKPVRLRDYPHRQTTKGVSVQINRGGKRSFLASAFIATMPSGHRGVFVRRGASRLPIDEPVASRPVDALLHKGEVDRVLIRGRRSLEDGVRRLFPLELAKKKAKSKV